MSLQICRQRKVATGDTVFIPMESPLRVPHGIHSLFLGMASVLEAIPEPERWNVFYTLAHHRGADTHSKKVFRSAQTFEYQTVIPIDIDRCDSLRAMEYAFIVGRVFNIPAESMVVVNSGNGVHCLIHLRHQIHQPTFFNEYRDHYNEICYKIGRELRAANLPFEKVDPAVFDAARVFRLPGTVNRKTNQEDRECLLVHCPAKIVEHTLDLKEVSGLGEILKQNVLPKDLRRQYPTPDFPEMAAECRFVQQSLEHPEEIHEPNAFDLFSLFAAVPENATAYHDGADRTPEQLAEWVFEHATSSKSLEKSKFQEKWEQANRYGARKCDTIHQNWGKCHTCPHYGKLVTPLALKSKRHIGSEVNGFWVLSDKGKPINPHYEDLVKVFQAERNPVADPTGRILLYEKTHYTHAPVNMLKQWIEFRMSPPDELRITHRNEFVEKVKARISLSEEGFNALFGTQVEGKLNCRNGILNIRTGEITHHSPEYGFRYVLPYEIAVDGVSEYFLEWLSQVMMDRVELIELVLDMMAYALWPNYDDHVFFYLVGEGKNGKSTLIEIMQAIVGRDNFSAVSIDQLVNNRFAPASLEGKLVNLSEESSGSTLDSAQLNVIKNLSSGGTMSIERKNEQGYLYTNRAKMIFSANETPRFKETGSAIQRRLIVVPFDYMIGKMDPGVKTKLLAEVPHIAGMLIRRIQENIAQNQGKFLVQRGGAAADEATRRFLTAGNTTMLWAQENIESHAELSEDDVIDCSVAYEHYETWVTANGFDYKDNKTKFGKIMRSFVVTKASVKPDVIRLGDKIVRVYRRTKYKNELEDLWQQQERSVK